MFDPELKEERRWNDAKGSLLIARFLLFLMMK
jgi:hypothetical protein